MLKLGGTQKKDGLFNDSWDNVPPIIFITMNPAASLTKKNHINYLWSNDKSSVLVHFDAFLNWYFIKIDELTWMLLELLEITDSSESE